MNEIDSRFYGDVSEMKGRSDGIHISDTNRHLITLIDVDDSGFLLIDPPDGQSDESHRDENLDAASKCLPDDFIVLMFLLLVVEKVFWVVRAHHLPPGGVLLVSRCRS